jgi:hypothetical protein
VTGVQTCALPISPKPQNPNLSGKTSDQKLKSYKYQAEIIISYNKNITDVQVNHNNQKLRLQSNYIPLDEGSAEKLGMRGREGQPGQIYRDEKHS